ncbi:SMI1/KNR4 family protein [Spirosoma jeollabukense]
MEGILERLNQLSLRYPEDITLYPHTKESHLKVVKGIGRIPDKFNPYLLEFLKFTNGASILDYCFMGFKNRQLGIDLDTYMLDFWFEHNRYAFALPFMRNTQKEHFCLWMEPGETFHSVVYIDMNVEGNPVPIASTFYHFIDTFVRDLADSLLKGETLYITENHWPLNQAHWLKNDPNLEKVKLEEPTPLK